MLDELTDQIGRIRELSQAQQEHLLQLLSYLNIVVDAPAPEGFPVSDNPSKLEDMYNRMKQVQQDQHFTINIIERLREELTVSPMEAAPPPNEQFTMMQAKTSLATKEAEYAAKYTGEKDALR